MILFIAITKCNFFHSNIIHLLLQLKYLNIKNDIFYNFLKAFHVVKNKTSYIFSILRSFYNDYSRSVIILFIFSS